MIFRSIIPRLLLGFLLLSPLPLAGLTWLYTQAFDQTLQKTVLNNLSSIADKKSDQINTYLNERMADALILSKSESVSSAVEALATLHTSEGFTSPRYQAKEQSFHNYFRTFLDNIDSYDLLLTDTAGNVVLSVLHEPDFISNLNTGPYRDTALAHAHREALALLDTQITQTQRYAPSANKAAVFIVAPILHSGKIIGTVALQLDMDKLIAAANDTTGLGKTGETVLAQREGNEVLYVGPLRHIPKAAFHYRAPLKNAAKPMQAALAGEHNQGITKDYAGWDIIAVWRYIPALRWGMVVKMDTTEAFAPAYQLQKSSLIALGLLLLIAGITALLFGRALVAPIQQLIAATRKIADGDLTQRAPVQGWAEIQQLADSFNHMTDHLAASYHGLEQKIEQRTVELKNTNQELLNEIYERQLADEALRQSKERFQTIIEAAPNALLLINMEGRITFLNSQAEQIFGYPREELLGKSIEMLIPPAFRQDHPHKRAVYSASPATRDMGVGRDIFGLRKDGTTIPLEIGLNPINMQEGQHIIASIIDITERKRTEQALKQLNEELEQRVAQRTALLLTAKEEAERANHAKSEFLSRMSHELRTPMNAILGFSQILEADTQTPLSPDQLENVQEILHAGSHLLELINEVLDLARIESGRIDLSLEPVEVCPLIEECVALLKPLANVHQVEITSDLNSNFKVQADRMRLRQVILNLLSNAIKYNRVAGNVQIHCNAAGTDRIRVAFHDTGRGIPPEALQRLFKPFERMESAYDGIEGTGIGLALSKRLTDAMGGTIGVESTAGKGSIFWVEFPLASPEAPAAESISQTGVTQISHPNTCTLLYVEDNLANLRLVQKIISTHTDLALLDASSAEQGLEIANAQKPDIILLDINLPGMDGFEALQHLQNNPATRDIPVIAITSNAMERDIKHGLDAGFTDYLTKPLDISKFLALLDKLLKQQEG